MASYRINQAICALTLILLLIPGECSCPLDWEMVSMCTHPVEDNPASPVIPTLYCQQLYAGAVTLPVREEQMCIFNPQNGSRGMGGGGLPG